jgi:light-regulated signal transduction histidine kinase (bacteriophytochrome)
MDRKSAIRDAWQRYSVAVAVTVAAGALRLWPLQALGGRLAWLTFYPAVAVGALYGGFAAGMLATFLSCLAALWFLPALAGQTFIRDSTDWLGMAVFFATCTLVSGIAEATRRANARTKQAHEQAEAANRELEAFSYSVAHDLRAPLRGMNGFAQVLLDAYGDKLDAEGQDALQEILLNARRMGALIDALLSLSRVTRSVLKPESVDLSAVVRATASQLSTAEPQRTVELVIQDHLRADLDPILARTLVENVLGNAWKFTSKVPAARIEFGVTEKDRVRAFYVRDNGAGFDMAFANKLFAPFQRLHTVAEFPGTGIGLATVQRIVHRQGGRLWAEGTVDGGATFYFALPRRDLGGN